MSKKEKILQKIKNIPYFLKFGFIFTFIVYGKILYQNYYYIDLMDFREWLLILLILIIGIILGLLIQKLRKITFHDFYITKNEMNFKSIIKVVLHWVLLIGIFLFIFKYKNIPKYHEFLIDNSFQISCGDRASYVAIEKVPCYTRFDCTRKKLSNYCKPNDYVLGTKCDDHCDVDNFCLDGYCRSTSYMAPPVLW